MRWGWKPRFPLAWAAEGGANPTLIPGAGNRGVQVEPDGDGPGNRSDGCARSLGGARGGESAAKTPPPTGSSGVLVSVDGVSPAKGDLVTPQRDKAMVGDGDAMGVGAQIVENILGPAEGRLAVDHLLAAEQGAQEGGEGLG